MLLSFLILLFENLSNGFLVYIIYFINLLSILCAILVIISKNPILSVLFLIALFLTVSIYLMLLGINFLGLAYLLVYVGAVSILFLFILMLINIRVSELSFDTRNSIPLGIIVFTIFYYFISQLIPYNNLNKNYLFPIIKNEAYDLTHSTSKIWDGNLVENSHINTLGNILYTNYAI